MRPTATAVPLSVWRTSGAESADGAVPRAEAPRLVVGRVRARGELAVALLAGDPCLAVELARGRGAQVADRDVDDPVRDLERLEDPLLDREDALVLGVRLGGLDEREHLDLVELVDAEDAARVLAGGAGLAAKAGRDARVADGQLRGVEDVAGVERRERDLRGADQEELVALDLVDHLALAREVAGALERALADQDRRHDRLEPLGADALDGEAHERQLDHDEVAEEIGEAGARRLRRLLHLDPAVAASPGRGGRGPRSRSRAATPTSRRVTPSPSSPSGASGDGRFGSVRGQLVAARLDLGQLGLHPLDLAAELAHLGDRPFRVLARALRLGDLVGDGVPAGAPLLDLGAGARAGARPRRGARRGPRPRRGAPAPPGPARGPRGSLFRSSTGT